MKKENKYIDKSKCCNAPVIVDGDIVEGTMYWVCTKCKKPCDIKIKKEKKHGKTS